MVRPLRSTPITGASSLLRTGPPARPASVLNTSQFLLLGALPLTTPNPAGGGIRACLPTQGGSEGPNLHQLHSTTITWTYLQDPDSSVRGTPALPIMSA